jgi:hypothetical protein
VALKTEQNSIHRSEGRHQSRTLEERREFRLEATARNGWNSKQATIDREHGRKECGKTREDGTISQVETDRYRILEWVNLNATAKKN